MSVFKLNSRIGLVSTWNTKCGIATYSAHLFNSTNYELVVFSPLTLDEIDIDQRKSIRCWNQGDSDDLLNLEKEIIDANLDGLFIQFHYEFFNFQRLSRLLKNLSVAGLKVGIILHATIDREDRPNSHLIDIAESLRISDIVLVHSINDLERLKVLGVKDNVELLSHGVLKYHPKHVSCFNMVPTIATFGFCFPHKGLLEIVKAVSELNQGGFSVKLDMINSEYPTKASLELVNQIKLLINKEKMDEMINFNSSFLNDEKSLELLSKVDLVVYPYHQTAESASGAVRYGLCAQKPVAVTNLEIFSDIKDFVWVLSDNSVSSLVRELPNIIREINSQSELYKFKASLAKSWLEENEYSILESWIVNRLLENQ